MIGGDIIAKRRVRLGSGLDPLKLADTIQQIRDDELPRPALICHAEGLDHGWVHLQFNTNYWSLIVGYPRQEKPDATLKGLFLEMPFTITRWESHLYMEIHVSTSTDPIKIAHTISQLMFTLQSVPPEQTIELALEHD